MNNKENKEVGTVSETNLIEDVDNEVKILHKTTKVKSYIKILEAHFKNKRNKEIRYIKRSLTRNFVFIRCGSMCIQTFDPFCRLNRRSLPANTASFMASAHHYWICCFCYLLNLLELHHTQSPSLLLRI